MTLHLRTRWRECQAKRRMSHTDHMRVLWWRALATLRPARVIEAKPDPKVRLGTRWEQQRRAWDATYGRRLAMTHGDGNRTRRRA